MTLSAKLDECPALDSRASRFTTGGEKLAMLACFFVIFAKMALAQMSGLPTLTTTRAAHQLSRSEAARAYPVRLHGVITYYDADFLAPGSPAWFVNDSTGGIFVMPVRAPQPALKAGQLVEVRGFSGPGQFAPIVDRASVTIIGDFHLPSEAPQVTLSRMLTGMADSQWVEVEGIVRSVEETGNSVIFNLSLNDGDIAALTIREAGREYKSLIDAKVSLRGNAAPIFNHNGQLTGAHIYFPGLSSISVKERPPTNPFASPRVSVDALA